MTLRSTLPSLIGLLGLMMLATAGGLACRATRTHLSLVSANDAEQGRASLFALVAALHARDLASVRALAADGNRATADTLAPTDAEAALQVAIVHFADRRAHPDESAALDAFATALAHQTAVHASSASQHGGRTALSDWHRRLTPQFRNLEALADRPQGADQLPDPVYQAMADLRETLSHAMATLVRNRILIELRLRSGPQDIAPPDFATDRRNATSAESGAARAAAAALRHLDPATVRPVRFALSQIAASYRPAEDALFGALRPQGPDPVTLTRWREASDLTLDRLMQAEAGLSATAADHLAMRTRQSRLALALYYGLALCAAALVAVTSRIVMVGIVAPLDQLQTRLDRLAKDDFSDAPVSAPVATFPEIAAIQAALDRCRDEGQRRARMQAELARLADRVVATNRQMTEDLEAAARVQRAQLPAAPSSFPSGMFHAFFRPSRVVAGDTYDCLVLPDGRSRVFQIDVSGHGAPAALVSIASHIALKQAFLSAPPAEPMAEIIARINRDWADDLPYFTLLAVEIDPARAVAHVVQCGHPALIRLPATGGVEPLGQGGLPIGVLPGADFSTLTCPFRTGDRLVLATDGVTETADPDARMFGDDRFRDLLTFRPQEPVQRLFDRIERALWDWRGSEILEDDITILVLEAA